MDLVSIQKNGFSEENESLTTGLTNGNYNNRNVIQAGHSDFMTVQRYEDLIGVFVCQAANLTVIC